jgi:hypothetical protein
LLKCEVCGRTADKHHIVHKCEGGLDFPLNFKYLCVEHHRGRKGPHKNFKIDIKYKLQLQEKLQELLQGEFFLIEKLTSLLDINSRILKKLLKDSRRYKEGYRKDEIIYKLMGCTVYKEGMLEEYEDFIPVLSIAQ